MHATMYSYHAAIHLFLSLNEGLMLHLNHTYACPYISSTLLLQIELADASFYTSTAVKQEHCLTGDLLMPLHIHS